jgi:antitoxin VapB
VYTLNRSRKMQTVKVFKSGNSQAVRIPKEFVVDETEMYIKKIGSSIILMSKDDPWSLFRGSIKKFSDDLFTGGREQPEMQDRESF